MAHRMKSVIFLFIAVSLAVGGGSLRAAAPGPENRSAGILVNAKTDPAKAAAGAVAGLLDQLALGAPVVYRNATVFPIFRQGPASPVNYSWLDAALKSQTLVITELGEGSVAQLQVANRSQDFVFLMTGEVLTGARQDRILAHDIILGPRQKELTIPVYCVEHGRWTAKSDRFDKAENAAAPNVRQYAVEKRSQTEIWNQVGQVNEAYGKGSSQSMQESFQDEKSQKERAAYQEAVADLGKGKGVIGAVVAIGGKIVGADVFATPELFSALWPKLVESYALDAYRQREAKTKGTVSKALVENFLGAAFAGKYIELQNPGEGAEFLLQAKDVSGAVLIHENRVVHLALFPAVKKPAPKPQPARNENRMAPQVQQEANPPAPQRQLRVNEPQRQMAIQEDDARQRQQSYKPNGMEFELKNPKGLKVKSQP